MANLRMVVGSLADAATLTATSEAGDLVASNLQRSGRETLWRSTSTTATLSGSFTETIGMDCIVLGGHNISGTGTIRLILRLAGDVVYDSGVYAPANNIPLGVWRVGVDPFGATFDDKLSTRLAQIWLPSLTLADEFEFIIDDPGNPAGFVQAQRLLMGQYISPEYNLDWGGGITWLDSSEHIQMEGGGLETARGVLRRQFSLALSHLNEADRIQLETELAMRGLASDVFISLYPERGDLREVTHQMIARRDGALSLPHTRARAWTTDLTFIEA